MLPLVIISLGFAGLAMSACSAVTQVDDMTSALCVDETTGHEFEYLDFTSLFPSTGREDFASAELLDEIYQTYLNGHVDNGTLATRETDTVKEVWTFCSKKVVGFCSNTHVVAWTGTGIAFAGGVTQVITYVNGKRENKKPRSICTHYKNEGTICVSWALYEVGSATTAQIKAVSNSCEQECEQNNWSCESRLVQGDTAQYFCVSNRADGCTDNNNLKSVYKNDC